MGPFFEDVPSENAVFHNWHKPVLAWEREARLRLRASKHEAISPRLVENDSTWKMIVDVEAKKPIQQKCRTT